MAETQESRTLDTVHQVAEGNNSKLQVPQAQGKTVTEETPTDLVEKGHQAAPNQIEATIITPFRSAAIAGEVGGIIEGYNFEIGDHVRKGEVILEISKKRYALVVQKAKENLEGLRLALRRAKTDKEIKSRLVSLDASSQQELLRAEAEFEITEYRVREAETTLQQGALDLEACQVKAPFTGYLAARYKEAFEATSPLERIFSFVDNSKVYAIAHVPVDSMPLFKKGSKAVFRDSSGHRFIGEVAMIEPVIDPKTATQKIYVLIDNAEEKLAIGMTGSLEPIK